MLFPTCEHSFVLPAERRRTTKIYLRSYQLERSITMNIDQFAERFRVRIKHDECGDPIIPGRRGHLYFAGAKLCLMVIDGAITKRATWESLGGHLWLGDISPSGQERRVQDVRIDGIPLENAQAAIEAVRCRPKRVVSAKELEASRRRMLKARESLSKRPSPALKAHDATPPVRKVG